MTRPRITHDEAQRVLAGQSLAGRPDLDALARAVDEMRVVAHSRAPQPNAALRERLAAPQAVGVSAEDTPPGGIKKMLTALAGWGIAAKIATGTGALALGVVGVGAAGAAGALPGPLQESFDSIVSTVETEEDLVEEDLVEEETPLEEELPGDGAPEELPVGSDEFGSWVSENAKDPDKVGAEFGQKVSEQARELRDENRDAREGAGEGDSEGDAGHGEGESLEGDEAERSTNSGGPGNGKGGRP